MNFFMIDESLNNEINAVYNIDASRDLEEDVHDAVEIAKKFDGPETDTHFICGSLFGLVPIGNRLFSSFQLMIAYLWYQNPTIHVNKNKRLCTFLRGQRWSPTTKSEYEQSYRGDERFSMTYSVGDDLELFNEDLKKYLDCTKVRGVFMEMYSTFLYCLIKERKTKNFQLQYQLFSHEKKALMNTYNNEIENQIFKEELYNNQIVDEIYLYHSCFRFTSSINENKIKKELLKQIDWNPYKNRNITWKKAMRKMHQIELKRIEDNYEKRIREIDFEHKKQRHEFSQEFNLKLANMWIFDFQRREIKKLYEKQFEEMAHHDKKRHEETIQIQKEKLEQQISIINDELRTKIGQLENTDTLSISAP